MHLIKTAALAAALLCQTLLPAAATETVRIASLDMLSGGLAGYGHTALKHWQFMADKANREKWAGDVRFQIVEFDNKMSPQEALALLKQVEAQGIRYVVQGASSSAVGIALQEAIQKHNDRNPGKEIVYLNYASAAPVMTNERCSYWHFRTDAHVDMKLKAMITHLAADKAVKRVYLLNPNYAYGHDSSKAARKFLAEMRPDVEVVGDDFFATGQVKDFAPYVTKIMSTKADALITVGFGNDLALMVKAANDMGLKDTSILTLSGSGPGMGTAFGEKALGKVKLVIGHNMNDARYGAVQMAQEFKEKMKEDLHFGASHSAMKLLAQGIRAAGSTDPAAVAARMEGMTVDTLAGPAVMRRDDHQLQMPVYVDVWTKADGNTVKVDQDGTGLGWRTVALIPSEAASFPTTCKMKRPD